MAVMKIAIIGAGAVGGFFGARLKEAGHDVTLVARGETLKVLRERGVLIKDPAGERLVRVPVVPTVQELGDVDVVLIATKALAQSTSAQELLAEISPEAIIATTQNAVEAPLEAAAVVGEQRVWPGVVRGFFVHTGPGAVEFRGGPTSYTFKDDGPRAQEFAEILQSAGIDGIAHSDIWVDMWEKAMFVTAFGGLGAFVEKPLGVLRTYFRDSLKALMTEIYQVAQASGVQMPVDSVARTMDFADQMPENSTSSMQRDLLSGQSSELDAQLGAICRAGQKFGVKTPLHDLLFAALVLKTEKSEP